MTPCFVRLLLDKSRGADVLAMTMSMYMPLYRMPTEDRSDSMWNDALIRRRPEVGHKIFELYAAGKGFGSIARQLNDECALCPRPLPGRPDGWTPASVRQILLRPVYHAEKYSGRAKQRDQWGRRLQRRRVETDWKRIAAEHLRIVSDELWNSVHERLIATRQNYLRSTGGLLMGRPLNGIDSKYLLTGLAECA